MIAREGLPFIAIGLLVTVLLILLASRFDSKTLFVISLLTGLLTLFVTFFFRDPPRSVAPDPYALVSPADGRVLSVDTVDNQSFVGNRATRIAIFLSVFDVHINRIPVSGVIDYVKYNPGKFFAAYEDKASLENEQTEIGMTATSGEKIIIKQIAGIIARRIVCRIKDGDTVTAGERFGLIRFGSRTELFVPVDADISTKVGDHIAGGKTILGYLTSSDQPRTETNEMRENNAGI
ncbi:MAG TPA: phosphatidylserine decarboxylase family protein [candidate division Zixibacteria bacterium]|nr:phosphatidylserine decarboxylase family protein [candidate division Zixibacteria bacterium]